MERESAELDSLVAAAAQARERARAPFSGFRVGAAARDADGRTVGGCNVESASYGLTMCAERVALFRAVAEGLGSIAAVAVVAEGETVSPCGACRQILAELAPEAVIVLAPLAGARRATTAAELLPDAFTAKDLPKRSWGP